MRFTKLSIVSCLVVVSLSLTVGCGKKPAEDESKGAATKTETEKGTPAVAAAEVEVDKPVSEIQAQAQTMNVDSLKATALKYKEAILAKQVDIDKLTAKIKDIPVTQALGEEAKKLKTDLETLQTSVTSLKDRFQVYYDALKTKGADLAGLAL